jgi:Gas vesicle protein
MKASTRLATQAILEAADDSLLDLVDNLLNRGVVVSGEVFLGLAGVDLVYLRLTALLCAADRILPRSES